MDLFSGKMKWDDPKVKEAMKYFAKMQDYLNPDHSALSWDQAIGALIEGKVAFSSMGDWADGEFIKAGKKENVDFGWVSHPGTDGSFIIVADGFMTSCPRARSHKRSRLLPHKGTRTRAVFGSDNAPQFWIKLSSTAER